MRDNYSSISFKTIGNIRTPFKEPRDIPVQTYYSDVEGMVELDPKYLKGLKDLEQFSHVILLTYLDRITEERLIVKPPCASTPKGVFATRAPLRPNPIGLSIVELLSIDRKKSQLKIKRVDMLDNTPLLDIKPYIPFYDHWDAKNGWMQPEIMKNTNGTITLE